MNKNNKKYYKYKYDEIIYNKGWMTEVIHPNKQTD